MQCNAMRVAGPVIPVPKGFPAERTQLHSLPHFNGIGGRGWTLAQCWQDMRFYKSMTVLSFASLRN